MKKNKFFVTALLLSVCLNIPASSAKDVSHSENELLKKAGRTMQNSNSSLVRRIERNHNKHKKIIIEPFTEISMTNK